MPHLTMSGKRHAIALTLVMTAALCADRAAAAAPQVRPATAGVASRVIDRLALSLSRVVNSVRVIQTRTDATTIEFIAAAPEPVLHHPPLSPFEFRLPPPVR
jgi:hypothetical protein